MWRSIVILLIAGAPLAACAPASPPALAPAAVACDDGGETGGVVINGVCL